MSTATAQTISALLNRAGFTRAVGRGTGGFGARKVRQGDGDVRVRHWFQSMGGSDTEHRTQLEGYAKAITGAGYAARIDEDGRSLIVSARKEG